MSVTVTGVGAVLCAAHRDRKTGAIHGHTWEVVAWCAPRDAVTLKQWLDVLLSEIDHGELPEQLSWGEAIAEWIGRRMAPFECIAVDVSRPAERIYARWEA